MANFLVTGVAGFIAARVAEMLLDSGHTVVGVDNMNDAYDVRMKSYRLSKLKTHPKFTFHLMDISKRDIFHTSSEITKLDYEAVFNLAARAGVRDSVIDPWVYIDTNMTGTLNLLEMCKDKNIPKLILASTSSIYGDNAPLPTPENANTDRPLQPYAASKKGAEALCHTYHYLYDIDITIFRYFTVFGPAPRPNMVMFRFTKWISEGLPVYINGDGEQSRGFTFLDDIARGTIMGLKPVGYEIINLGGHETVKVNELLHIFEELIGHKAVVKYRPRHPADMLASWADTEKAGRLLGWEPEVSLREGIMRLISWYNSERSWASHIET
jgi:nucleoside-diphosphate-sugar epimerase